MIPEEKILSGIAVAPGIAIGHAYLCASLGTIRTEQREIPITEVESEVQRFLDAIEESKQQILKLREQVAREIDEKHAEIYVPQLALLEDVTLIERCLDAIRNDQVNAEYAFARIMNEFLENLRNLEDGYFAGRETDFQDVALRVINNLSRHQAPVPARFGPDTILVATDLLPSQTANLLKDQVVGLALEKGGPTSHTAIIAKATEIPTVVGVEGITHAVKEGAPLIVDGLAGKVIIYPSAETYDEYLRRQKEFERLVKELEEFRDLPAETTDGYSVILRANIEFPEEVSHIALHGAKGVGLFRTEFIFLNRPSLPTEEEQYAIYKEVAERVFPETVVFRTLDVGGDKFFAASQRPRELNPFMGLRAVRLCLKHPEIFRPQLRAMLRANALGNAKILVPMISGVEEFLQVKEEIYSVAEELRAEGFDVGGDVNVGAMIETPSAAILADELARECNFFSIGTNDLIQYTLAVDRGNRSVAYLYEPLHTAVLRLIKTTIKAAEDAGISVSVCGEVAADPLYALLLVGLGVYELSMSAVNVPAVKQVIRSVSLGELRRLVEDVFNAPTIAQRKSVLRDFFDFLVHDRNIPPGEILSSAIAQTE
jgi:phosphotransferase system enzyme I (PtsI)